MTASLHLVTDAADPDWQLARRAAAGDEGAFESLYRAHSPRVFALCLRMAGSRGRAIELTQDVFVHLWERLGSFRGESALASWIHRVAVNVVLNAMRRDKRRGLFEVNDGDGEDEEHPSIVERKASVRPASVLEAVDLERAIAALPPGARIVFVLHDVEGYRHEEIARMTGTAEGTCRAQLHRARKLLMEGLDR